MSTRNQLAIVDNKYQGSYKRTLCVCSAGLLRSPTTAVVLQKEFGRNTRSAGTMDYALIPISEALIMWADEIVVMERRHKSMIQMFIADEMPNSDLDSLMSKIIVLDIPDNFEYMNDELQSLISEKYKLATEIKGT